MSHAHSHENTVPKPALVAAGVLIAFCLALATATSLGFVDRVAVPQVEREAAGTAPVTRRSLRFADTADGGVRVSNAETDATVALIDSETQSGGFVRGVMRGMARERRMHGVDAAPPFALTLWEDGSLSLLDDTTGRSVELGAFGPDNRAIFAAMLENGGA